MSFQQIFIGTSLLCLSWSSTAVAQHPELNPQKVVGEKRESWGLNLEAEKKSTSLLTPSLWGEGSMKPVAIAEGNEKNLTASALVGKGARGLDFFSSYYNQQLAQNNPNIPPGVLEPNRPTLTPLPTTPQTPNPLPPLTSPPQVPQTPPTAVDAKVKVQRVEVLGSTAFSPEELQAAVASFIGKEATFEDLLAIRAAITTLYTQNGYTTSGAFLPPQDVTNGVVQVQVVEGAIEKIEIQGLRRLQINYVRSRLNLATQPPVNIHRLEETLQLLQVNSLISNVQAELSAGTSPGLSVLKLTLREAQPLTASFLIENRDSPSVGSIRGTASIAHNNLLGFGDRFGVDYGVSKGINTYNINYEIPVNARDGRLNLSYNNSNSRIIEAPFNSVDINADSSNLSLGFRQPLVKTIASEFTLGLSLDLRRSQTYLLEDVPFSFPPLADSEKGKTRLTVLRFSQDWVSRSTTQVLAARSQFSFGLDAFDATVNNSGVDGQFTSWLGQFQLVKLLGKNTIFVARTAAQFSFDSLLPIEQFSVGGIETVRGYQQGQLIADNGIVGSLEVRFPIVSKSSGIGAIQLVPFLDIGTAWNNQGKLPGSTTLASLGLGLRWQLDSAFSASLDWGIPLISISNRGDSLQDNGLSFSLRYQPF